MDGPFTYASGRLAACGVSLADIAGRFGTPLYILDIAEVARRVAEVREAFAVHPTRLCYSVKANPGLSLLRWFADRGLGFDIVSGGELARVGEARIEPGRVLFAGVGKTERELQVAVETRLWAITVESVGELERLHRIASESGGGAVPIALRLNPGVDARTHPKTTTGRLEDKFGLVPDEFEQALAFLRKQGEGLLLDPVGLHLHIGSQITDTEPYQAATAVLVGRMADLSDIGSGVRWLDLGGGFGISYDGEAVPSAADYAEAMLPGLSGLDVELVLELGRYLVGPAGALLTEVQYVKEREAGPLVIVDAGMNDLLRPALYGAQHRVVPVTEPAGDVVTATVAGPVCESGDVFAGGVRMPLPARGDILAIMDTGAYGGSMAGNYNSRPRPAEVMITPEGEVVLCRRREGLEELFAAERADALRDSPVEDRSDQRS